MARPASAAVFADMALPTGVTVTSGVEANRSAIAELAKLPVYNILNGDQAQITPYLVRSTLPEHCKWVPVAGMRHEKALECADAFIRSHIYFVGQNCGGAYNAAQARKVGLILGVARAVMYANYQLSATRMNADEVAAPVMLVTFGTDDAATPTYRCLATDPRTPEQRVEPPANPPAGTESAYIPDPRGILIDNFELTQEERMVLSVITKCAQAIIPLQGYGLITDGHHYLSDVAKNSYRACHALEKQLWAQREVAAWFDETSVDARDILWHKAGHPVAIHVKEYAATSQEVADNLIEAELGGAATRLPAIEPEAKAISAYLRVTNEVRASWESRGGTLDNSLLQEVSLALNHFPKALLTDGVRREAPPPIVIGATVTDAGVSTGGTRVNSRREVVNYAKALVSRAAPMVAVAFGYYTSMAEAAAMSTATGAGRGGGDSLMRAYSLKKLRTEYLTGFTEGMAYYRDHESARSKARKEGRVEAPRFIIV